MPLCVNSVVQTGTFRTCLFTFLHVHGTIKGKNTRFFCCRLIWVLHLASIGDHGGGRGISNFSKEERDLFMFLPDTLLSSYSPSLSSINVTLSLLIQCPLPDNYLSGFSYLSFYLTLFCMASCLSFAAICRHSSVYYLVFPFYFYLTLFYLVSRVSFTSIYLTLFCLASLLSFCFYLTLFCA